MMCASWSCDGFGLGNFVGNISVAVTSGMRMRITTYGSKFDSVGYLLLGMMAQKCAIKAILKREDGNTHRR